MKTNFNEQQILVDPMRIAWLLRADLRDGANADAPISDWFKVWWLIHGRREYPAWSDQSTLREAGLFRPLSGDPDYGGFGMTPALRFLLDTRNDLHKLFPVDSAKSLQDAIAWLFVHGVNEHRLAPALDENTLIALDTIPPFFIGTDDVATDMPELTWLMFFVWKTDEKLQQKFDLQTAQVRHEYSLWFLFDAVPQLNLAPLLAPRWTEWLRQPIKLNEHTKITAPRAGYFLWQRHPQLQRAFNIELENGVRALAMWTAEAFVTEPTLSWINPSTPEFKLACERPKKRPFGLNLIGFAFGELGIGEDVRMAVEACKAADIPFTVLNINPGDTLRQEDLVLAEHVTAVENQVDSAPYSINLFCLTAFDTARVYLEQGTKLFSGRYNIGWWPWELPVWPRNWTVAFNIVNEVWAATNFTRITYEKPASKALPAPIPVTLMPMPATVDRVKPIDRKIFNLSENRFLFLYVFDFNSYLDRKNPFSTLNAFRKAFPTDDDSVGLVFKTMNADPNNTVWKEFIQICKEDSRITVLNQTLDRGEVLGLIQTCDAYISLHRSEGFGRTLAEAMLFGKPVIATNFSGNTDFLSTTTGYPVNWEKLNVESGQYPFVEPIDQAWWADPSLDESVEAMRNARFSQKHEFIKKTAMDTFSPVRIGKMMKVRLELILNDI